MRFQMRPPPPPPPLSLSLSIPRVHTRCAKGYLLINRSGAAREVPLSLGVLAHMSARSHGQSLGELVIGISLIRVAVSRRPVAPKEPSRVRAGVCIRARPPDAYSNAHSRRRRRREHNNAARMSPFLL